MENTFINEQKPKKSLARAIVSMGLGIVSVNFSIAALICALSPLFFSSGMVYGDAEGITQAVSAIFKITMEFTAFVELAFGVATAIVSLVQGRKFVTLYGVNCRMTQAGKILSIISFALCVASVVAGIIACIAA